MNFCYFTTIPGIGGAAAAYLGAAATYLGAADAYMGAAASYMMDYMRIRLNSAQLKAETGGELGKNRKSLSF